MALNRALLEVLKFLDAKDILVAVSSVCKLLGQLSNSEELWREIIQIKSKGKLQELDKTLSLKQNYRMMLAKYIPVISPTSICKYQLLLQTWTTTLLSETITIDRFASTILLDWRTLFVTGAPVASQDTFQLDAMTGAVTYLQCLHTHRTSMGVILHKGNVYAFCGFSSGYLTESEVFKPESGSWTKLPPALYSRSAITPSQHLDKIYLIGGCGTDTAEYFSSDSNTFTAMKLTVTPQYCTVSICRGEQLIAIQEFGYYSWDMSSAEEWKLERFSFDLGMAFWSGFDVIEHEGIVYVLQLYSNRIVALNLQGKSYEAISFTTQ